MCGCMQLSMAARQVHPAPSTQHTSHSTQHTAHSTQHTVLLLRLGNDSGTAVRAGGHWHTSATAMQSLQTLMYLLSACSLA